MDLGNITSDSLAYTKEGVFSNVSRWLKLILALILLGIPLNGYSMRIYRNAQPAPEVDQWGSLFIDGLKLMVIGILYAIPIIILWVITYSKLLMALLTGNIAHLSSAISGWTPNLALVFLMYVFEIIVGLLVPIAYIRFARTNYFAEAFNFSEIFTTIRKIGWINYIVALILVSLIVGVPVALIVIAAIILGILSASLMGTIIAAVIVILVLSPLFVVFQARFMTQVYNSAEPAPAVPEQV